MPTIPSISRRLILVSLSAVLLVGIFLRLPPSLFTDGSAPLHWLNSLHPTPKWHHYRLIGVDEDLYRGYVEEVSAKGLTHYPDIVLGYIEKQANRPGPI